jgi:GNAT superfamily N-acetyltransferase
MASVPSEIRELAPAETGLVHQAMCELRPAYQDRDAFVAYIEDVLRPEGYRLLGAFTTEREQALAAAGFRVGHSLAWGHHIYVDDLCTLPEARHQGHAGALLEWLIREGRNLGCTQLHLDSGTDPERFDAHRLYYNHGLAIHSHHFARGYM